MRSELLVFDVLSLLFCVLVDELRVGQARIGLEQGTGTFACGGHTAVAAGAVDILELM